MGHSRQDPALEAPLLPELSHAAAAAGSVEAGRLRIELQRARNRIDFALSETIDICDQALAAVHAVGVSA